MRAYDIVEEEYIQWDYGKGYVDALAARVRADRRVGHAVPVVRGALRRALSFCPRGAVARWGRRVCTKEAHRERDGRARRPRATCPRGLRALLSACGTRSGTSRRYRTPG